jgi:predicted NBD/HSP70 family sugar kinase
VRRHNLAAVLGQLHRHGPSSRAQLTRLLGLNRATIGALVEDLASRGLVREDGEPERKSRGRPSKVVAVRADTHAVLALQVGVEAVTLALVGLGGTVLAYRRATLTGAGAHSVEHVVATAARLGRRVLDEAAAELVVVGIGVAAPGAVSLETGLVHFAPNLGWRDVPLGQMVRSRLGLKVPVQVGNDGCLGAMAEHSRGVGSRVNDLVYLHAEVGVGGGIIAGGRMLDGFRGYGGEVGHMQVNPSGLPCHCGLRGCWETESGEEALVRRAGLLGGGRPAVQTVLRRARAGDPTCLGAVRVTAEWIGVGLITLVNVLNPEMVILGGMFEEILELARPTLTESLLHCGTYGSDPRPVELAKPRFGKMAVLLGAAELALQALLADPTVVPPSDSWQLPSLQPRRSSPTLLRTPSPARLGPAIMTRDGAVLLGTDGLGMEPSTVPA